MGEELHLIILYILLTLYLGTIVMLAYYIAGSLRLGDIAGGIKECEAGLTANEQREQ